MCPLHFALLDSKEIQCVVREEEEDATQWDRSYMKTSLLGDGSFEVGLVLLSRETSLFDGVVDRSLLVFHSLCVLPTNVTRHK